MHFLARVWAAFAALWRRASKSDRDARLLTTFTNEIKTIMSTQNDQLKTKITELQADLSANTSAVSSIVQLLGDMNTAYKAAVDQLKADAPPELDFAPFDALHAGFAANAQALAAAVVANTPSAPAAPAAPAPAPAAPAVPAAPETTPAAVATDPAPAPTAPAEPSTQS